MPNRSGHRNILERRIDAKDAWALRYWSHRFGVSYGRLKDAIQKVGPGLEDLARELETPQQPT